MKWEFFTSYPVQRSQVGAEPFWMNESISSARLPQTLHRSLANKLIQICLGCFPRNGRIDPSGGYALSNGEGSTMGPLFEVTRRIRMMSR